MSILDFVLFTPYLPPGQLWDRDAETNEIIIITEKTLPSLCEQLQAVGFDPDGLRSADELDQGLQAIVRRQVAQMATGSDDDVAVADALNALLNTVNPQ